MEIAAANPEAVNAVWPSIGITPLHIAAANCNVAMIDYLLRYSNLDVAARDAFGRTPLQIAITMGRERTIETLFRATFPENFTDNDPFDRPVIVFPGRRPPEP
jgi:ankyrin repeat protein